MFYSEGALLRLSSQLKERLLKYDKILILSGFGLAIASIVILNILLHYMGIKAEISMHFIGRFSVLPIIGAIGLFLLFSNLSISSAFINSIAQSAFAVYLISENPNIFPWFWKLTFDNMIYYDTPYMIGMALLQCAIVFIACIIIDKLYKGVQRFFAYVCKQI